MKKFLHHDIIIRKIIRIISRRNEYNLKGAINLNGGISTMDKPSFTFDQIVKSTIAAKNFGLLRKMAQKNPIVVTDNGVPDSVIISYTVFETMVQALQRLEEKLVIERIERAEEHPESLISLDDLIRSMDGKHNA
jgi:PHD/YefM family antitoxin component YafN of YafNO toxin-antitoxin module